MSYSSPTFSNTEELFRALKESNTLRFDGHDAQHMWALPSAAARHYWLPIMGPTATLVTDVITTTTRRGPVSFTAEDLAKRLGVPGKTPLAIGLRRAVVFMGGLTKHGAGNQEVSVSFPRGVNPPSARLRDKYYSNELRAEFDSYITNLGVQLNETDVHGPAIDLSV